MSLKQRLLVNGQWSEHYHRGLYMCNDEDVNLAVEANYSIDGVSWDFDDGQTGQGEEIAHHYEHGGHYLAKAYIHGTNTFSMESIYDSLSVAIHVGEPEHHEDAYLDLCDVDTFDYYGVEYTQSGHYERIGTSIYGCDSTYILDIDMGFTPNFEFVGAHWPVGGSETYISVNEYAIQMLDPRTHIDTVLWQIDCPNWYVVPHGKGESCTLYIYSYLLEPVTLHATAVNRCGSIHQEFFIQTSYHGTEENAEASLFEVSPNPTDGPLTLRFNGLKGLAEIKVLNSMGQTVDAFSLDMDTTPEKAYLLPPLNAGLYYVVVQCDDRRFTRKIVLGNARY